ncbi:chitin synthase-domain-containing protein [Sporodiniella umbellata]|nr:chitin synthase-domain-containing protein [Sporodiniella umbellata]
MTLQQQNQYDFWDQEHPSEDDLAQFLKLNFSKNSFYFNVSPNVLLAVNPYKTLPIDNLAYTTEYKDGLTNLPAHVYKLTNHAYLHMRRTGIDQSILFFGETGTGKTENFKKVLVYLAQLSQKRETKLQSHIQQAQTVFESFGHARTLSNDNASRFAQYIECQFSDRGRMTGAKVLNYLLEKTRLTHCPAQEQSFHVFYQLFAGISSEEKEMLQLNDDQSYRYIPRRMAASGKEGQQFEELRKAMRSLGLHRKTQIRIWQLLSALLHLGQLEFVDQGQEAAVIKNGENMDIAADFLGVDSRALENLMTYKTVMIQRDVTTLILNASEAAKQRDRVVQDLYSLLFSWLVEQINKKICHSSGRFIGVLDFPGPRIGDHFHAFCINLTNERIQNFFQQTVFDSDRGKLEEGLVVKEISHFSNQACLELLMRPKQGLCDLANRHAKLSHTDEVMLQAFVKYNSTHDSFKAVGTQFSIHHFSSQVTYAPEGFVESNQDMLNSELVQLVRGGPHTPPSHNAFIKELFVDIHTQPHPKQADALLHAQQPTAPLRTPSMRQHKTDKQVSAVLAQLNNSLDVLLDTLKETLPWFVICVRPNLQATPSQLDINEIKAQIRAYGVLQIGKKLKTTFNVSYSHKEFLLRYASQLDPFTELDEKEKCLEAVQKLGWEPSCVKVGLTKVFIEEKSWQAIENNQRKAEKEQQKKQKDDIKYGENTTSLTVPMSRDQSFDNLSHTSFGSGFLLASDYGNQQASIYTDDESEREDVKHLNRSQWEMHSASERKEMLPAVEEKAKPEPLSPARRHWLRFVWWMTWWIPTFFLAKCGKMKRGDVQIAWREKMTLCMMIFFTSGFIIWFLIFFGGLVCPHQDVFSTSELQSHSDKKSAYVAIRGEVFDLTKFAPHHWASQVIPQSAILEYGGKDATELFPVQVSALCQGISGQVNPYISLDFNVNMTSSNARYHNFLPNSEDSRPDWYFEKMTYLRKNYKLGDMGYTPQEVKRQAEHPVDISGLHTPRIWVIMNNHIFDLTLYILGGLRFDAPPGQPIPERSELSFLDKSVVTLFTQRSGQDITLVKFLAALQFGTRRDPEKHDKFVICQIPCYTESEDELRKTIDSIASLQYDDKRKLLFIICDGMIVGGGNDRPTPRIVLDILGVEQNVDPEALSFFSVGEGQKQHNMAKIYSGLYETRGHVVPYIVVAKAGKPSERQKPGNRGKRDSQLVLMSFLNKVHFDSPMTPMELELYHQIKNVIGVNPKFYEYVMMVDADTEVMPDGLNRLVSVFTHDSKVIGLCGETVLSNEKDSWVTMIQVYEYYISHYLIKAFESLFGSVTCLPGCFCMYRIRSPQKNQPLLISNQIIQDYAIDKVDTLHKKNLLHLGEDRYLTTLILKHFPTYKTRFVSDAKCATNAPDQWSVLLSQRRRWINSTIHNLGELVFLPQLCGFCCFSMRFVVMLDLLSTLVQPAIVGYLVFLIYSLATSTSGVPVMSIITIAGVYGLQAAIFLLRRKWEHIAWMIVSIFAIPVFSFAIPIYSYWHFDDFSWGNTRVVMGDKGKRLVMADEGEFDRNSIPLMKWDEYEQRFYEDINKSGYDDIRDTVSVQSNQSTYYSHYSNPFGHP